MSASTIFSGLKLADSVLGKVLSKKGTRLQKKIEAVRVMQRAVNNTRQYLVDSNDNYVPNAELSNLWNDAFGAMMPIDKTLAVRLNNKSRFWSNPQVWLIHDGAMELVPDLNELDEKCDTIIVELENRL